jgi:hypothetical protein
MLGGRAQGGVRRLNMGVKNDGLASAGAGDTSGRSSSAGRPAAGLPRLVSSMELLHGRHLYSCGAVIPPNFTMRNVQAYSRLHLDLELSAQRAPCSLHSRSMALRCFLPLSWSSMAANSKSGAPARYLDDLIGIMEFNGDSWAPLRK